MASLSQWLDRVYRTRPMMNALRNRAAYFAWSDRGAAGLGALRLEEEAFKAFKKDFKRFQKKSGGSGASGSTGKKGRPPGSAPVLRRPPISQPLQLLHQVRSRNFYIYMTYPSNLITF